MFWIRCLGGTLIISTEESEIMDTVYFVQAMNEFEKKTGKKCIIGLITSADLSALLLRAQELKLADREKK